MVRSLFNKYTAATKEKSFKGKYLKNLSSSFILNVGSILITYLTNLILTNITNKAEYGAYVAVNNLASIIALFAPLGLSTLVIRQIGEYKSGKQFALIKGMNHFSAWFIFTSSAILSFLTYLACVHFDLIKGLDNPVYLIIGLSTVPFLALMSYHQAVLSALQHTGKALLGEKIIRPILLAAGSALIFYFYGLPDGGDLINLFLIACIIVFLINYSLMRRGLKFEIPEGHGKEYDKLNWIKQGWIFVPISMLSVINAKIDVQMIGMLMDKGIALDKIAVYNVANKAAQGVSLALLIANYVLGPSVAELYYSNEMDRLQNVVTKTAKLVTLITIPPVIILIIFGKWLLGLYGEGYEEGYTSMIILTIGQFINVFTGSVGYLLLVTKNEKYSFWGMGISVVLNIALNYLLIDEYGIEGVSFATALAIAAWNFIMLYYLLKKTGINPLPFSLPKRKN